MANIIKVGMADIKICKSPDGLTTLGLGSCVGVAVRDPISKIGGLLHAMLPDSTVQRGTICVEKFVDSGLEELVRQLVRAGANQRRLEAKLAGGAKMFDFDKNSELVKVGDRNAAAARAKLKEMRIRLLAEDTGLNYGRTVIYYPETGIYVIKAVGKSEKTI